MDINTQTALEIFGHLIKGKLVNYTCNEDLYNKYIVNHSIQEDLESIASNFGLRLYRNEDVGLFVVTQSDNEIFGYTNKELRELLKCKNNTELYLTYFVIYCVISVFYIQNNYKSQATYIRPLSLVEKVDQKLQGIGTVELSIDEEKSFASINKIWTSLPQSNIKDKKEVDFDERRGDTKLAVVNRALHFLVANKLMSKDPNMARYDITPRFSAIIENYFEDIDTDNIFSKLVELGN